MYQPLHRIHNSHQEFESEKCFCSLLNLKLKLKNRILSKKFTPTPLKIKPKVCNYVIAQTALSLGTNSKTS